MTLIMTIQKLPEDIMVSGLDPTVINQLWIHNSPGFHIKANCKDTGKNIRKMLRTGRLDYSAISYATAFMATPKKKNQDYTSNNFEISEIYPSSDDSQETDTSDVSLIGSKGISELSSKEDSDCGLRLPSSICHKKQRKRMHTKSTESHCSFQNKKCSYIVSIESRKNVTSKARFCQCKCSEPSNLCSYA
jgi:hypothetical protein